jgi:3-hydroxyisobutyrate dehydrogenase-like beta-hydroxyacid dehydrogenase
MIRSGRPPVCGGVSCAMMAVMSANEEQSGGRLGSRPVVGVLHPGAMGAALGSALKARAGVVIWADGGRSHATAKRAELADLIAVPDVAALAQRADLIVSICPPHAALELAEQVAAGLADRAAETWPLYLDANAVAPATVRRIAELLGTDRVVDGAVIGPPAWERGQSALWLSGAHAGEVAGLFADSPFDARVLGAELGPASTLKACYALQSKAMPAIWLEIAEAAEKAGVSEALHSELSRIGIDLPERLATLSAFAGPKAWRFAGEMDEAADAMAELGLPDGFSRAAAELYRRWSGSHS